MKYQISSVHVHAHLFAVRPHTGIWNIYTKTKIISRHSVLASTNLKKPFKSYENAWLVMWAVVSFCQLKEKRHCPNCSQLGGCTLPTICAVPHPKIWNWIKLLQTLKFQYSSETEWSLERLCRNYNKQRELIPLNRQGTQQQRPALPTVELHLTCE